MLSQAEIKRIRSLQQKKIRRQEKVFIAEGDKIVRELFHSDLEIEKVYAQDSWIKSIDVQYHCPIIAVSESELKRISTLTTPNKVLALVKIPTRNIAEVSHSERTILALDNIQDPGNMGTIIRTADWFGINTIVCSKYSADIYNPKVIQATMGSFMRVNVYYADLSDFLSWLPQYYRKAGAFLDGSPLDQMEQSDYTVLVVGNESQGISDEVKGFINQKVRIPMCGENHRIHKPESLNAAIATGIMLNSICNNSKNQ